MNQEVFRCLQCQNAKCQKACPVHTNIPLCMEYYRLGKREEAGQVLFSNNPMSVVTSLVCDWQRFCYGNCILNAKGKPVAWYEIEQELSTSFLEHYHPEKITSNNKKIAIIGGGPAGMTAAIELRIKGYRIDLFDNQEKLGGVLRYGIPEFRLERKYIDSLERICEELGIAISPKKELGKDIYLEELKRQYDGVLLTVGTWKSQSLHIKGEDFPHVHHALDYLKYRNELGQNVIVVGGGNVAMDAARVARRNGKDVTIYYRKTFENMPANKKEIEETLAEGISIEVYTTPVQIKEKTIVFAKCENIEVDRRVETKIIEGTEFEVAYDDMILAVGERKDLSLLGDTEVYEDGSTSETNIFVAGDYLLGPSTVVEAVQSAKEVAQKMIERIEPC